MIVFTSWFKQYQNRAHHTQTCTHTPINFYRIYFITRNFNINNNHHHHNDIRMHNYTRAIFNMNFWTASNGNMLTFSDENCSFVRCSADCSFAGCATFKRDKRQRNPFLVSKESFQVDWSMVANREPHDICQIHKHIHWIPWMELSN